MKIILKLLPILLLIISCQNLNDLPNSPVSTTYLEKKPSSEPSIQYAVHFKNFDGNSMDYTVVSNSPGLMEENGKNVKWNPEEIQFAKISGSDRILTYTINDYVLSGEARLTFSKKGNKIVSFQFWIWDEDGPLNEVYQTGKVVLSNPFVVPDEVPYTIQIRLTNQLYKKVRNKVIGPIGIISFGDILIE